MSPKFIFWFALGVCIFACYADEKNAPGREVILNEQVWRTRCLVSPKVLLENMYNVLTDPRAKLPNPQIGPQLTEKIIEEKAKWNQSNIDRLDDPLRLVPMIGDVKALEEDVAAGTMKLEVSGRLLMVEAVPVPDPSKNASKKDLSKNLLFIEKFSDAKRTITLGDTPMRWIVVVRTTPQNMTLLDVVEMKPKGGY